MAKEYDFTQSQKNPYVSRLKRQITIWLDEDSITYFKGISEEIGIPYQSLISLYLRDCAAQHRKLDLKWEQKMARHWRQKSADPHPRVCAWEIQGYDRERRQIDACGIPLIWAGSGRACNCETGSYSLK
jgi:hypothetical protein